MSLYDRFIIWRARRKLDRMAAERRQAHINYPKNRAAGKLGHARKRGAA